MHITYHLILSESAWQAMDQWPAWCEGENVLIQFSGAGMILSLSTTPQSVRLHYRDLLADLLIRRESVRDVKDINDELGSHLEEEHTLALNVSFEGEQAGLYLTTLALAVAVLHTQGFCYIEGDGAYLKPVDARAQIEALRVALN